MVLAFTGLRWEEAVAVPVTNISLESQWMIIDRTASEAGGRRDVREDMKTRGAVRTVMIPDIAMPAVSRLADRSAPGRERSGGQLYTRLINGDRRGYLGYAMWRRYLKLAQGYTAAHPDGIVRYTAHEMRRVRLTADRLRRIGHAGRSPDGPQQNRDNQEHLRAPVRMGPRRDSGRDEPGRQPFVCLREARR